MSVRIELADGGVAPSAIYPWSVSGTVNVGDVVALDASAAKTVLRADADNASARPPIGVCIARSGSLAQVALNGEIASGLSGLTRGTAYWLSTSAGQLVSTKPGSNAYAVGVAVSATELLIDGCLAVLDGSGGGGGTVTSVGITSSDFSVSNSPITTSGAISLSLNTVSISDGGTGQTTATAAFNALSPLTAKGDLIVNNGSDNVRLSVDANNKMLTVDSSTATGLKWGNALGQVNSFGITSSDSSLTVSNSPITGSGSVGLALNTVGVAKGGTGLTSASEQGAMLYASSSSAYVMQSVSPTFKNRIINGGMTIAQRGTAAVTAAGARPVDRWAIYIGVAGTWNVQQVSTAPTGFSNSVRVRVTSPSSATASQAAVIQQSIEGFSVSDLAWGAASAQQVTVSFWVNSSVTGTYCVAVRNGSYNRSYVGTYSITTAGTWEKKSVSIPGDILGVWAKDNSIGIDLSFDLGSGSNFNANANTWTAGNLVKTTSQANFMGAAIVSPATSNDFYLTGVQLEVGSVATAFELRPEQVELALCQRYFQRIAADSSGPYAAFGGGVITSATSALIYSKYPVNMRALPTLSITTPIDVHAQGAWRLVQTLGTVYYGDSSVSAFYNTLTGWTSGRAAILMSSASATAGINLTAEL